jgi:hypothetical protein
LLRPKPGNGKLVRIGSNGVESMYYFISVPQLVSLNLVSAKVKYTKMLKINPFFTW